MEEKIKKFFRKKKADTRFKYAGPGHKLNEESTSKAPQPPKDAYVAPVRSGLTNESKQAAAAALARLEGKKPPGPGFNTSLAAIKSQVKKELEAEKAAQSNPVASSAAEPVEPKEVPSVKELAVCGVYYRCPAIGEDILSKEEWGTKIREFLQEQYETDSALTAVIMLFTFNKNKEKVDQCVDIICKYFGNILQNPTDEKYRKIRKSNKVFTEKVAPLEGANLVLEGAGFVSEDDFYVFPESAVNEEGLQHLEMMQEALKCAEPISLTLDRNLMVLLPSQARERKELPSDFFRLTPEELKKEQQARSEAVEKSSILMTKAMREKYELRDLKNYRYSLIRIKFPDGIMLQGTFGVYEPFSAVLEFLKECLTEPNESFSLVTPLGEKLETEHEKSLLDLRLVPASILMFEGSQDNSLKPEVIVLCQELSN